MYDRSRSLVLRWMKVPAEPHPPSGAPDSLRVFRAGRKFFQLRLLGWALGQLAALGGIVFWVIVFIQVEDDVRARKFSPPPSLAQSVDAVTSQFKPAAVASAGPGRKRVRLTGWAGFKQPFIEIAARLPAWAFPLLWALKLLGFSIYLIQIPFTYALRRLDYEMRWYVVTDRSLRIRTGIWRIQELTMSFANLQQVVVTQGPVQRLFGLADVRVQSAGGGGGARQHQDENRSLHLGHFHGVDNAPEIRDLILARLRRFRESGLGDPEETTKAAPASPAKPPDTDVLDAARLLRDEARALRAALR
jgi:hypothetical protein